MRGRQDMAEWRPAKDNLTGIEVQPVGEIGPATCDQCDAAELSEVSETSPSHPLGQAEGIFHTGNAWHTLDTAGNLAACHHSPHRPAQSRARVTPIRACGNNPLSAPPGTEGIRGAPVRYAP